MLACTAFSIPCLTAVASTSPIASSSADTGSCSSPNVSARWNSTSESVEPLMPENSSGATASISSRRISSKPWMTPLWTNSHFPWRNGWQLVCWIAVPVGDGVAVGWWDRGAGGGRAGRGDHGRLAGGGGFARLAAAPGGRAAGVAGGPLALPVPAHPEAVAVGGLEAQAGGRALSTR